MFVTAPKQNRSNAPQVEDTQTVSVDPSIHPFAQVLSLQAVLEGLMDGVLLITDQGDVLKANRRASEICYRLNQKIAKANPKSITDLEFLPEEIWRVCQSLIESHSLFPDETIVLESEVTLCDRTTVRIRVRWFTLDGDPCKTLPADHLYILVTLEDCNQTFKDRAIADMLKYSLTPREKDIWQLRLQGLSYRDIATQLYISENTVRKHIKNILAKRRLVLASETDCL